MRKKRRWLVSLCLLAATVLLVGISSQGWTKDYPSRSFEAREEVDDSQDDGADDKIDVSDDIKDIKDVEDDDTDLIDVSDDYLVACKIKTLINQYVSSITIDVKGKATIVVGQNGHSLIKISSSKDSNNDSITIEKEKLKLYVIKSNQPGYSSLISLFLTAYQLNAPLTLQVSGCDGSLFSAALSNALIIGTNP